MVVCYPQFMEPWQSSREEDRRFRRILLAVLMLFSMLSYIVPNWELPQLPALLEEPRLPPRLARVITERMTPAPPPAATARSAAPDPSIETPAQTVSSRREQMADIATTPRAEAATTDRTKPARDVERTGVLALSEQLSALRGSAPEAVSTRRTSIEGAETGQRKASRLSADVTAGSAGLGEGLPSSRDVLGSASLPDKVMAMAPVSGAMAGSGGGVADDKPVGRPGSGRSQEEIQEILDRNKRAIYALYNRELRSDPTLRGKVVLAITIAPSGKVTECRIISSELESASLKQKLILLIERIDFGAKPGVPSISTHVPIEFFPA